MKSRCSTIPFWLAALSAGASLQAQTLTVNPVADTFVDSAQPGNNYGMAGLLGIAPSGAAKGEFDGFMKFDLSGAAGWTVQSITLQLTTTTPNNPLFNGNGTGPGGTNVNTAGFFSVQWLKDNSWVEGTGSPSSADTSASDLNFTNHTNYFSAGSETIGTFSFNGASSGAVTYTLPLTPNFLAAVQVGTQVTLYVAAADSSINYLFNSENFGTVAARPTLKVTALPEPGSLGLAFTGLATLALRRRR